MYFIIGQGLAGTCLAHRFLEADIPFRIFDNNHKSSSTMIAPGLWNPVVFKRITKSWMADELIDALEKFYPEIERKLNTSFYHTDENIRLHSSYHEKNDWESKMDAPEFEKYLDKPLPIDIVGLKENEFTYGLVKHTGHLNLPEFLTASQRLFIEKGVMETEEISLPDTIEELNKFEFKGIKPDKIIDCRGAKAANSMWWKYLPFKLAKGEVLTLKCPDLNLSKTLNAGVFVLPVGNDVYKVGSTFTWEDINSGPSELGKTELIEKFEKISSAPFEIISHLAGVRPTVADRRPLLGHYPTSAKLVIFNGLGTKGVMLAPYFSAMLSKHLIESQPLHPEVDINRFMKRYQKSI